MRQSIKCISVVTPCFNERDNVSTCHAAVKALFQGPLSRYDFEHIFADNCSTDGTVQELRAMAADDVRVRVILNARNFGPFRSSFNALLAATGDAVVVLLPADLQDPPSVIADFVSLWEQGFEVVAGVRDQREEPWLLRAIRKLYYRAVSKLADINMPVDVGEFQLIDRRVVDVLRQFDDYYPYVRGMIASCGFNTARVPYKWVKRQKGKSKNRWYHLVDQGLNGLISSTNIPMRLCMAVGIATASASIACGLFNLVFGLVFYQRWTAPGIITLIVSVFFFSGLQLFFFGVLGEYIAAIHSQVRKRPLVIERERINFGPPAS